MTQALLDDRDRFRLVDPPAGRRHLVRSVATASTTAPAARHWEEPLGPLGMPQVEEMPIQAPINVNATSTAHACSCS